MPRKGMRSIFFKPSTSSSSPSVSLSSSLPLQSSFDALMDLKIDNAHTLIAKWDSDQSPYAKFQNLFYMLYYYYYYYSYSYYYYYLS